MPLAPVDAEVPLDLLQHRNPVLVDLVAAVEARGSQAVEKSPQLLTAGQNHKRQYGHHPAWSLHGGDDVLELPQKVIPSRV